MLVVASGAAAGLLDPVADAASDVTTPLLEGNPAAAADTVVETATGTATEVVAPVVEEVLETAQPVVNMVAEQAPVEEIVQVVTGAVAQAPGESGSGAGLEGPVSAGAASAGGSIAPVPAPSSDTPAGEAPGLGNPLGNAVVRQDGQRYAIPADQPAAAAGPVAPLPAVEATATPGGALMPDLMPLRTGDGGYSTILQGSPLVTNGAPSPLQAGSISLSIVVTLLGVALAALLAPGFARRLAEASAAPPRQLSLALLERPG